MGGSKSGSSAFKTYNYFGTIAGVVCAGVVDELVSVIVDGAEVWPAALAWVGGATYALNDVRAYNGRTWRATSAHTASTSNAPEASGSSVWVEYGFARGAAPFDDITIQRGSVAYGTLRIYWGTQAQTVDPLLQASGNDAGETHPDYKGVCYIILKDFLFGREKVSAPNVEVVVRRKPGQFIVTGSAANLNDGQANLAAVACELLTDTNALGLTTGSLDATSFQNAANVLDTMPGMAACSPLLDSQDTLRSILDSITALTDNFIRFNPSTRLVEMGVYNHGNTPATFTTLTVDDLTEQPKFTMAGWSDVKTRAVVTFNDRVRAYKQSSDKVDDSRAFFVLGEHRPVTLDRPYITRRDQAIAHATETLRTVGRPVTTGEISVRREKGRNIRAGDYILLDIDLEPGGSALFQYFRVTQRTIPQTGPITFSLLADNSLSPIPWSNPSVPTVTVQETVPEITNLRVVEGPFKLTGEDGAVVVLAERSDNLITGFHLYFSTATGGPFVNLGSMANFAARATLASDITATAGTIRVTVPAQVDADRFTQQPGTLAANDDTLLAFIINEVSSGVDAGQIMEDGNGYAVVEIASISASALVSGSDYDLTVLRGRLNSKAQAFNAANSEVWIIPRSVLAAFNHADFATIRSNRIAGTTPDYGYFRLTPFTYLAERQLADCASSPFHFPLKKPSAPNITTTAPATPTVTLTNPAYPASVAVTGTIIDADSDLVQYQILLRKDTDTADRLIFEQVFTGTGSKSFNQTVFIETAGTYTLRIRAFDVTGLWTDKVFIISATGTGAKVMAPVIFFQNRQLGTFPGVLEYGCEGPLTAICQTPGATIKWQSRFTTIFDGNSGYSALTPAVDIATNPCVRQRLFRLTSNSYTDSGGDLVTVQAPYPITFQEFLFFATAPGMAQSNTVTIRFQDAKYV